MPIPFFQRYTITPKYLSKPSKRRSGIPISNGVKFIVAHDTGNPGSTANGNVNYYENSRNDVSASAHLFVDDKNILECIPALTGTPEKAWHVLYKTTVDNQLYGYDANDSAIGVEYCYGDNINADEAYKKYVWVIAYLCAQFGLDPAHSIVGHFFLDPKRKTDPVTGLAYSRRSYDQFLKDVVYEYGVCANVSSPPAAPANFSVQTQSGTATTTATLNIRKSYPSRMADIVQQVPPATSLNYAGWVTDGEAVNGNKKWFFDTHGNYFWSGATA